MSLLAFESLARPDIALIKHCYLALEGWLVFLFGSAKNGKELCHTLGLIASKVFLGIGFVADPFDLDFAQFDLSQLVLFVLSLVNDDFEVTFADLAVAEFFVHAVLVLHVPYLLRLLIELLLLVIPLLEEVFVDYSHRLWSHTFLLFGTC